MKIFYMGVDFARLGEDSTVIITIKDINETGLGYIEKCYIAKINGLDEKEVKE